VTGEASRITIETPIEFSDGLPEKVDAVIIGGGVIGVFSALYLARMGKRVLVCEKGRVSGEQSSRNWGWIRQHGRDRAELPIMMQALRLWREADAETNGQCGVVTAGTHYLASSEKELAALEDWLPIAREQGLDTRVLSGSEVSGLFSGRADHPWVGGTCTPSDARGEPWVAVPAVARLARAAGALIRENCAVRALDLAAGQIQGVVTESGRAPVAIPLGRANGISGSTIMFVPSSLLSPPPPRQSSLPYLPTRMISLPALSMALIQYMNVSGTQIRSSGSKQICPAGHSVPHPCGDSPDTPA